MTLVLHAQTLAQGKVIDAALKFVEKMANNRTADTDAEGETDEVIEFKQLIVQARRIQADIETYFKE